MSGQTENHPQVIFGLRLRELRRARLCMHVEEGEGVLQPLAQLVRLGLAAGEGGQGNGARTGDAAGEGLERGTLAGEGVITEQHYSNIFTVSK